MTTFKASFYPFFPLEVLPHDVLVVGFLFITDTRDLIEVSHFRILWRHSLPALRVLRKTVLSRVHTTLSIAHRREFSTIVCVGHSASPTFLLGVVLVFVIDSVSTCSTLAILPTRRLGVLNQKFTFAHRDALMTSFSPQPSLFLWD